MPLSARLASRQHAYLLQTLRSVALDNTYAAAGRPPGARFAGSGGGGGGGGRASDAKQRAAQYVREKESKRQAAQQPDEPSSSSSTEGPRSRLAEAAAEWSEGQQALFLSSPSGLGVGAEAAISQAIKDGALDSLKGKGKPLPAEDHSAQFGRVDPLVAAVTRTMGAQGVKPLSLELRDEVRREIAALRRQLEQELRTALQLEGSAEAQPSGSSSRSSSSSSSDSTRGASSSDSTRGASSASSSGWFGGWFGGGSGRPAAAPTAPGSRRHTVSSIRGGQHPALQHAAEELRRLIQQYNNACLADKEAFGAFWPLDRMRQLDWHEEVEAALERIGAAAVAAASSGGGGSSRAEEC